MRIKLTVHPIGPTACQNTHWKSHKRLCHLFKNATWDMVPITKPPAAADGEWVTEIVSAKQQRDSLGQPPAYNNDPPPNAYGSRPFIVKIQRPLPTDPALDMVAAAAGVPQDLMLMYDQQRTFTVCFDRNAAPEVYDKVLDTIVNDRVCGGMKTFRWAKRIGDWQLSICLSKALDNKPPW
jgi:hypothetical protein